jgi:excisionase family DNA binding protein
MESATDGKKTDNLLMAKPVSEWLNLPLPSLYDYARRGLVPCVRIGKNLRFRRSDIEKFIEDGGKK